jgi:hypothetical protein
MDAECHLTQKMTNKRTEEVFRDAIAKAIDAPFEGELVSNRGQDVERLKARNLGDLCEFIRSR